MALITISKRKKQLFDKFLDIMDDTFIEKMKFIENIESLIPNPNRFFEKLICFKEIVKDKEKVLFFIARDKYNERTTYQKSIEKNLFSIKSKKRKASTKSRESYTKSIIDNLKEKGLIKKIEKCCPNSNCSYEFERVPDECPECGHHFFLQEINFPKESNRPYYTIEITENGIEYLNNYFMKILKACYFCIKWFKYLNEKSKI